MEKKEDFSTREQKRVFALKMILKKIFKMCDALDKMVKPVP